MAIMNKLVLASAALAALVNAVPMNHARDAVTDMVTETTWTTVDVDITVWVDGNGQPYSTETGLPYAPAAPTPDASSSSSSSSNDNSPPAPTPSSTTPPAGSFYQAPTPAPSSTSQYQAAPAPQPTTTQAPAAPAPAAPAPQSSSTVAAAVNNGQNYGAGSSSAGCTGSGDICSGDVTYYDGGLGSCGTNINSASDMVIALPVAFMEAAGSAWPNPLCGKSVTIVNPDTGVSVQAKVGDKCMGCSGRSIDLTHAVFNAVAPNCDGRCSGFKWFFSS